MGKHSMREWPRPVMQRERTIPPCPIRRDTGDPTIRVEFTEEDTAYCIRAILGEQSFLIHTRSAVDLHHKLGLALLDWMAYGEQRDILRTLAKGEKQAT